jgi:hypothetical protein
VKALGDAVHQELGGRSSEDITLKFMENSACAGVMLWPRTERGKSGGTEHRIAYSFILYEQREPVRGENEAVV